MEKDHDVPLIFGRPFLATGRALIDVQSDEVTLPVNEKEVNFNIYCSMKFPDEAATCHCINTIGDCVKKKYLSSDPVVPLERCLTSSRKKLVG